MPSNHFEINLRTLERTKVWRKVPAVADTGAEITMMPTDLLEPHLQKCLQPSDMSIRTADRSEMICTGMMSLEISVHDEEENDKCGVHRVREMCYFSPAIKTPLISVKCLKRLKLIPKGFPYARVLAVSGGMQNLEESDQRKCDELFAKYASVFDINDTEPMKAPPLLLKVKDDGTIPHLETKCRRYPLNIEEECINDLKKLVQMKIIEPVSSPSTWCAQSFFLQEGENKRRFIVDLSKLSKVIERPVHPFISAADILKGVDPRMKYFATLDAKSGYFQLPLDPRCKHLTTFLTPIGRFCFLRTPMGLNASSDHWCKISDQVVDGIENLYKLVDDILLAAPTMEALFEKIEEVLERCKEANMHLNKKKFQIGEEVNFAGFRVFAGGYSPIPDKLAAVSDFKTPKTVTDIKSFLGLVNHLSIANPDISQASAPLRGLLKKEVAFVWTPAHQDSFDKVKQIILSPQVVHFYSPGRPVEIYCDAARNAGLGYVMLQKDTNTRKDACKKNKEKKFLIQCGSRSLTDCETRYSATELELLGLTYALKDCNFYLLFGPKFTVYTDHSALVGLFKKQLGEIENTRLQRLREKVLHYDFEVIWLPGKNNVIADVLSRNPVFKPTPEEDEESRALQIANVQQVAYLARRVPDIALDNMEKIAKNDKNYRRLVKNLHSYLAGDLEIWGGYPTDFKKYFPLMSFTPNGELIMYNDRLVVPETMVPSLMDTLHKGHPGIAKIQETARALYFWPGMTLQLQNKVKACRECNKVLPSLRKDNPKILDKGKEPMEIVFLDIFTYGNSNFLVVVDQYSSYFFVRKLANMGTLEVFKHCQKIFREYGHPRMVVSDNGPAFRDAFTRLLKDNEVVHRTSSPYFPEGNANAEAGVKRAKYLLEKVGQPNLQEELMHFLARSLDGNSKSPSELFFGRRPRLPGLPQARFAKKEQSVHVQDKLPVFADGARILVQNPSTKEWDAKGVVIEVRRNGRSYLVELDDGRRITRNRRWLREMFTLRDDDEK